MHSQYVLAKYDREKSSQIVDMFICIDSFMINLSSVAELTKNKHPRSNKSTSDCK